MDDFQEFPDIFEELSRMSKEPGILVIRDENDVGRLKKRDFHEIHILGNSRVLRISKYLKGYEKYVRLRDYHKCDIQTVDLKYYQNLDLIILDSGWIQFHNPHGYIQNRNEVQSWRSAIFDNTVLFPGQFWKLFDIGIGLFSLHEISDRTERFRMDKRKFWNFANNLERTDLVFKYC